MVLLYFLVVGVW